MSEKLAVCVSARDIFEDMGKKAVIVIGFAVPRHGSLIGSATVEVSDVGRIYIYGFSALFIVCEADWRDNGFQNVGFF